MDRLKDSFATLTSADGWKDMLEDEGLEYGQGLNMGEILDGLPGSMESSLKKDDSVVSPGSLLPFVSPFSLLSSYLSSLAEVNQPFFRILEGSVRVTMGSQEEIVTGDSSWPMICEVNCLENGEKITMSIIACSSPCRVQMIPREVLFQYCQKEVPPSFLSSLFLPLIQSFHRDQKILLVSFLRQCSVTTQKPFEGFFILTHRSI